MRRTSVTQLISHCSRCTGAIFRILGILPEIFYFSKVGNGFASPEKLRLTTATGAVAEKHYAG